MTPARTPIFYSKPSITEREVAYAEDAARHGWGARCYEYIGRLERAFADYLGVRHAIATSSCTGASHMGLSAIGVGPGDEVILGDINWIAVASPITYLGARPVFVDVLEDSWCLDPAAVEKAITPRTKAIIAVHLYGNLAAMAELQAIADRHNITLIEDSAEALGSVIGDRRAGSMGKFGTFSFHGTKTMTTGEGGMFVTDDDELFEHVATLANHGRARGKTEQFFPEMIGFKYKMSNLQAAIGLAQIERIDELVAGKRRVFDAYHERLKDLPLAMNPEPEATVNSYWMPSIVVDRDVAFDRDALLADFKADQIDGRVFFYPLSLLPMFEDRRDNKVSYGLYERALNLPTYHDLTEDEIDRVCAIVRKHLGGEAHPQATAVEAGQIRNVPSVDLRRATPEDAEALRPLRNDPDAQAILLGHPEARTGDDTDNWIERRIDDPQGEFLAVEANGAVIGFVQLVNRHGIDRHASFGMALTKPSRGAGLGRAALDGLLRHAADNGLRKLQCEVRSDNHAAIALYRSAGFREVGQLRDHYWDGKRLWDVVLMESVFGR